MCPSPAARTYRAGAISWPLRTSCARASYDARELGISTDEHSMPRQLGPRQMSLPMASAKPPGQMTVTDQPLGRPLTAADVLTAREVAALLHVPRSTVEDWARRGVIPSRKVGRRRLYLRPSIETLLLEERS
jgi:excisionase family DNA binding protein